MLNGLGLFEGIAGITIALSEWVKPIAYCERDRYAQSVLLSRLSEGLLQNIFIDKQFIKSTDRFRVSKYQMKKAFRGTTFAIPPLAATNLVNYKVKKYYLKDNSMVIFETVDKILN